jgi:hypothetical protein
VVPPCEYPHSLHTYRLDEYLWIPEIYKTNGREGKSLFGRAQQICEQAGKQIYEI